MNNTTADDDVEEKYKYYNKTNLCVHVELISITHIGKKTRLLKKSKRWQQKKGMYIYSIEAGNFL